MRILLIQPYSGRRERVIFPTGLVTLIPYLSDHEVLLHDGNIQEDPFHSLSEILRRFSPHVTGISLRAIDTTNPFDRFSYLTSFEKSLNIVRETLPDTFIVAGGSGFSLFPERIMERYPSIDAGVLKEGEVSFPGLLRNISSPEDVSGIIFRKEGRLHFSNQPPVPVNMEDSPLTPFSLFDLTGYSRLDSIIPVQTKRGCPFDCIYCDYPIISGKRLRLRKVDTILKEIEDLIKGGVSRVFFADAIFNNPPSHAMEIIHGILKRGYRIRWATHFNEGFLDKEIVDQAVRAGCSIFFFSPDTGSRKTMKTLKKRFDQKEALKAYSLFRGRNTSIKLNFFFNVPGENISSFLSLLWFIFIIMIVTGRIFFFRFTSIRIYPETEMYRIALQKGVIKGGEVLLDPRFYNPFPMNIIGSILHLPNRIALFIKKAFGKDLWFGM